jgi:hypothetical protein
MALTAADQLALRQLRSGDDQGAAFDDIWTMLLTLKRKLDIVIDAVNNINDQLTQEGKQMAELDDKITALQADVTAQSSVNQSAITLLNGIATQIAAAVQAAQAAGATAAQLQSLTDLQTSLEANNKALSDAVAANTPAAPPPSPAPTP